MLKEIFDRDRTTIGRVRINGENVEVKFDNQEIISMNVNDWEHYKERQGYLYEKELGQLNIFDM